MVGSLTFVYAARAQQIPCPTSSGPCTAFTLPAACAFSATGVTSNTGADNYIPNAPVALVGTMSFTQTNCAATITYSSNQNGVLGGISGLQGNYTINSNGIGEVCFPGNPDFLITVDSPGAAPGSVTQVRMLLNAPDSSSTPTTTSIVLVGTCKAQ